MTKIIPPTPLQKKIIDRMNKRGDKMAVLRENRFSKIKLIDSNKDLVPLNIGKHTFNSMMRKGLIKIKTNEFDNITF